MKISTRERLCLNALFQISEDTEEGTCFYARAVGKKIGLDESKARNSLRSLKRKGLVELHRGLVDDDGMLRGSGWRCTEQGEKISTSKLSEESAAS